jgi:hypothetical protein
MPFWKTAVTSSVDSSRSYSATSSMLPRYYRMPFEFAMPPIT